MEESEIMFGRKLEAGILGLLRCGVGGGKERKRVEDGDNK